MNRTQDVEPVGVGGEEISSVVDVLTWRCLWDIQVAISPDINVGYINLGLGREIWVISTYVDIISP